MTEAIEPIDAAGDADDLTPSPVRADWLADRLLAAGLIGESEVRSVLAETTLAGSALGQHLVNVGLVSRADCYEQICSEQRQMNVSGVRELPEFDRILNGPGQPFGAATKPHGTLLLAASDDLDAGILRCFMLTTEAELPKNRFAGLVARLLRDGYQVRGRLIASDPSLIDVVLAQAPSAMGKSNAGSAASVSEVHAQWDKVILEAWDADASDIHLIASNGRGEIQFRILGELEPRNFVLTEQTALEMASSMYNSMVDKGSTGDGFNPRVPQDAVVSRHYGRGGLRLRYSSLPVEPSGVNVTLRLSPMNVTSKPKLPAEMGYSADQQDRLERIFARSSGLILFLGTTGSGKTTSMANQLMRLVASRPGKKLRTVEEPVEIRIPGASQTTVVRSKNDEGTNEFAAVMRALMRSDPDYLMVGEIRDAETASLAIQAVRSGHLCISTLHAEGAPTAYDRLAGMGVSRNDIASVGMVAGFIYQRLVQVLCPNCKVPATELAKSDSGQHAGVLRRLATYLKGRPMDGIYFRSKSGCSACSNRGIVGRTVCAEILVPKTGMLPAIRSGDSTALWEQWRSAIDASQPDRMEGRTAFEHGLWKMEQGICSPVEIEKEFKFLDEEAFT